MDRLRFVEADTALHNHELAIKNIEQANRLDLIDYNERKRQRQQEILALRESIKIRQQNQRKMLEEFGETYGFDYNIASIDDKTGVVVEHPPGPGK
jgi:hypothetical protein